MSQWCGALLFAGVVLAASCSSDDGGGPAATVDAREATPSTEGAPTTCVPRTDVVVILNPAISETSVQQIEQALRGLAAVDDVTYVDQQAAYEEFQQLYANQPELLQGVRPEALPTSFRVRLDDQASIEEVELAAQGLDGVGQVIRPEPPPPGASVC
jgi:hypothetical protein